MRWNSYCAGGVPMTPAAVRIRVVGMAQSDANRHPQLRCTLRQCVAAHERS
jgi:hypothetical protein